MKPEKMRTLGIACAVIAGASYIMGIGAWVLIAVSLTMSGETYIFPILFALGSALAVIFASASIPLLIVSGIRIRRQRNAQRAEQDRVQTYIYCPYCGTALVAGSEFCSACGKKL